MEDKQEQIPEETAEMAERRAHLDNTDRARDIISEIDNNPTVKGMLRAYLAIADLEVAARTEFRDTHLSHNSKGDQSKH